MSHNNISIFIPHIGCPQTCSFCNQRTISGTQKAPQPSEINLILEKAYSEIENKSETEIAFFGGSFTAIDREYMISLLETTKKYIGENKFKGIRISTRPDYIDDEILNILKSYGVTAIELGAQSLDDEVLIANNRGHSCDDVIKSSELIRKYNIELGLQMMVGLYKSNPQKELCTMNKIIKIHPDTVRIYPVVILENTELGKLYHQGEYTPLPFDEIIELCADMLFTFYQEGINVIKCGLHASDGVEGTQIGGYYHPALRELCEAIIYRKIINQKLNNTSEKEFTIEVNNKEISKVIGQKKSNIIYFKNKGIDINIIGNTDIPKYQCKILRKNLCI